MAKQNTLARLRAAVPTVSVGMLTADLLNLGHELATIEQEGVELLHVDVMDGCFCPPLTVGPPLIKAMSGSSMLLDVHLMIQDPLASVESYLKAGVDILTIQAESTIHPHRVLQVLSNSPVVRGVALNPGTPLAVLHPLLDELELVMLLAVNPGWGGQKFIPSTARRIGQLRDLIAASGKEIFIAVDGGVTRQNVAEIAQMGPDILVSGSAIFDGQAPAKNARFMLDAVHSS